MKKRNSQKKLNGEILLMQTELMSKLATVNDPKRCIDDLGFPLNAAPEQPDALQTLISKSKDLTRQHAKQIDVIKRKQSRPLVQSGQARREGEGTFLTGLGMVTEQQRRRMTAEEGQEMEEVSGDPELLLKQLVSKGPLDELQELRKMIKETSSNLEGCSRKLNKSRKNILQMADRYTNLVPFSTMNFLNGYQEFEARRLEEGDYLRRY